MRRLLLAAVVLLVLGAGCAGDGPGGSPRVPAEPSAARDDEPAAGAVPAPATAVLCGPGTVDLGVHRGFEHGNAVPTRLCAVKGLHSSSPESTPGSRFYVRGAAGRAIVSAEVSQDVARLVVAARRNGVPLEATSSFRTMAHQRGLCAADAACRRDDFTYVAPPGFSNHQLGKAIDFAGTSVTGRRSCTRGRAVDHASPVWRFLARHAHRFGLRQYAAESWHWDATGTYDRC